MGHCSRLKAIRQLLRTLALRANRALAPAILALALLAPALLAQAVVAPAVLAAGTTAALAPNDISFIWPVPTNQEEVDALIDGRSVWPKANFDALMRTALEQVAVKDFAKKERRIKFPASDVFMDRATWKLVAFRVDPSAPSTHEQVIASFGSLPQIRLIMQPVEVTADGSIFVHDFAAHLPYSYVTNAASPFEPDKNKFAAILGGLLELKALLARGTPAISTDGPLDVHPGLAAKAPGFADKVSAFLSTHLPQGSLILTSFMGIEEPLPEPWFFFQSSAPEQAQMLFTAQTFAPVTPVAKSNRNVTADQGVSTTVLFSRGAAGKLTQPAIDGLSAPLVKDIPNVIANPQMSNVLNTDCVSCHSESTRRFILEIDSAQFRYELPPGIAGANPALLPKHKWNVRNFGWFALGVRPAHAVISQRTANETADALAYIRKEYQR